MKSLHYLFSLLMFALVFSGCSPSREKRMAQVDEAEKKLFGPDTYSFSKTAADSLVNMYMAFVDDYPGDTVSANYLFKAASIVMNGGDGNKAIGYFDRYLKEFPDGKKSSMCMFFKAFTYENYLGNLDKAREMYLLFIEKYPGDDFVDDAQMALMNLGKTPEMLIREFEAKQKADSLAQAVK